MASKFTRHPERYVEILHILQKYKLYHLLSRVDLLRRPRSESGSQLKNAWRFQDSYAENLTSAFEELGTCFIKLGQLMSTRSDLLPGAYTSALSRLQDTVTPVPGDIIIDLIERELGTPLSEVFQYIDQEPLATASIAQVHKAILHNGQQVVVKVQRPGVREQVETDIEVMQEVARFLARYTSLGRHYGLLHMVQELKQSLSQELDFLQEAENTRLVGLILSDFPRLISPNVFQEHTSQRLLTLSFLQGQHVAHIPRDVLMDMDTTAIAQDLLSAYLKQMVVSGIFHCDPHPGNILLTDDGQLALLDFGMVGRFDSRQKENVILLMLAFSERQGERVADIYLEMVEVSEQFNRQAFTQAICSLVSRYHDMGNGRMEIGRALLELAVIAQSHHTPIPASFTLLGKAMLNLDGTLRTLAPDMNPVQLIRSYMGVVMQQQALSQISPARAYTWLLDTRHVAENMPHRSDLISDKLAHDRLTLRLNIEHMDLTLQRVARKLSLGMIISSLVISVSLFFSSRVSKGS
ncbi:2-octaprenylphenol hydroxylase [Ktedonobacteria bacterium brp13]|nr:2-octaprenylphenol hydroxylase [Ktedonobacteria bacterium brp13]